jgi:hypothetical protein
MREAIARKGGRLVRFGAGIRPAEATMKTLSMTAALGPRAGFLR